MVGDVREFGPREERAGAVVPPDGAGSLRRQRAGAHGGGPGVADSGRAPRRSGGQPGIGGGQGETLDEARSEAVASPRTTAQLFGLFAALALVIAVAGIGSMLALWVRQRMREIGIRIALGAAPADILSTVLRQGMVLVALGLACGLGGALALTRLLKKLLFEVTPTDAPTYAVVSALLLAAALLACWVPARRAARIDPQTALRTE